MKRPVTEKPFVSSNPDRARALSIGGNVGLMDGSVSWKGVGEMKIYRGSKMWDEDGCFTIW